MPYGARRTEIMRRGSAEPVSIGGFELCGELCGRAAAYPDVESGAVEDPVPSRCAPVASLVGADRELHPLRGMRRQGHALEAFELAHRPGCGAVALVEVELHDFRGFSVGGIGRLHRYGDGCVGWDRCAIQGEVGIAELAVAQAVPEGEERCAGLMPVAASLIVRLMGSGVGVDEGHLADRARPAERELPAG